MANALQLALQPLLTALGAMMLRTGLYLDENWMLAPLRLLRRVRNGLALARAHLTAAALDHARVLVQAGWTSPRRQAPQRRAPPPPADGQMVWSPRRFGPYRLRLALPFLSGRTGRPFDPAPRRDPPCATMMMGRVRARIALLTAIAYESADAHWRRVRRLARTIVRRLARGPKAPVVAAIAPDTHNQRPAPLVPIRRRLNSS